MNRNILILVAAACIISAVFSAAQAVQNAASSDQKIDSALAEMIKQKTAKEIPVIVMLASAAPSQSGDPAQNADASDDISQDLRSEGLAVRYQYRLIPGMAGEATAKAIEEMAEDDRVLAIYFDGSTRISSPDYSSAGENSSGEYLSPAVAIKADRLWEKGIDGRGVTVAVIDSGIDKNHPDLVGRVVAEKNFLADEVTADDLLGHGTMVAGIIAGSGAASSGKYRGIAPGANLINVKVIDSNGDGKVSDIIAGIEWAVYSGADVLSLSLGGINLGETNPPITMAADNAVSAGVTVCVAAGNRNSSEVSGEVRGTAAGKLDSHTLDKANVKISQQDQSDNNVMLLLVPIVLALPPGLIDSPGDGVNVITVGAADSSGRMASFSGSGPTRDDRVKPDVVAPGVDIISTVPSGLKKPVYVDDYYARESGTSLSTPVAAGLSALLLQARDNLTAAGVKAAMTRGAAKLHSSQGDLYEEYYQGTGMLDALSSYDLLQNSSHICGAVPDAWAAGRWAYLPAGKGVYVGLDTGADRPQKKIYALAPGDEDWNLRFVFFSDRDLQGVKTVVQGEVSDWVSIQALPKKIEANDQSVFSASIAVPRNASSGTYNGSIEISDQNQSLLSIPISVNVARPLEIEEGVGNKTGTLAGNGWDYYYLDMAPGTTEFEASIDWQQTANFDLFLLSPTSEYYSGDGGGSSILQRESRAIEDPPSGKWLVVVHSENASQPVNYSLNVQRSALETDPMRWNLESAAAGSITAAQFALHNSGLSLHNLSYSGVIENTSSQEIKGMVGYKETWNYTVNATGSTKKLSASLLSDDRTNTSELMLVFETPEGEPYDALLGTGDLGPLEIGNPENGSWKVRVYGYDVPEPAGQSFRMLLKTYGERPWSWIDTNGPQNLESNESASLQANLTIPSHYASVRQDGYIKISSDRHSFEIPVSVTVAGARLDGLAEENVTDSDGDGLYDVLTLGFGVSNSANVTASAEYRLKGLLADCNGSRIASLDRSISLAKSGIISFNVSGNDIWRQGRCGPMQIENLILYDADGTYIDRFDKRITINRTPEQFQPPAAFLTGDYVNRTTSSSIGIGVNVTVMKPGRYELQGRIVNDYNEELDAIKLQSNLAAGNATLLLDFNPAVFISIGEVSKIHLVDLVLLRDGAELERKDYAWATGEMDPQGFATGRRMRGVSSGNQVVKLGGIKIDKGTAVIA
jgi:serine protease AprX